MTTQAETDEAAELTGQLAQALSAFIFSKTGGDPALVEAIVGKIACNSFANLMHLSDQDINIEYAEYLDSLRSNCLAWWEGVVDKKEYQEALLKRGANPSILPHTPKTTH